MSSPAQAPQFQIFIKGKRVKTMWIWAKPSDLVDDVKCKLAFKERIPVKDTLQHQQQQHWQQQQQQRQHKQQQQQEQRLIFNGRKMLGGRSLSDYHVRKNTTLFLVLRLRGGTVDERLSAVEGSIMEIELNYATDNYVDERDALLHDTLFREAAIFNSNIDPVHDRIDTAETENAAMRETTRQQLEEHSRSIDAIIAGPISPRLSASLQKPLPLEDGLATMPGTRPNGELHRTRTLPN